MMQVTVKFGAGNSCTKDLPEGTTIGDIAANAAIRGYLGFGENVQFYLHSQAMPNHVVLHNGDVVSVQQAASEKGS